MAMDKKDKLVLVGWENYLDALDTIESALKNDVLVYVKFS
jgi:hypothetical protein